MNATLTYLMDEICAGVEIYFTGRTGGQYLKTAFILCDDYTELVSKFFLLTDNPAWSDQKSTNRYKNYHDIMTEVVTVLETKMHPQPTRVKQLQNAMKNRRIRRNDFFHSTGLLDLSVTPRNCVESFCDLLEYGEMLLASDWRATLNTSRNLETFQVLLNLEKRAFSDPSITPKVNQILQGWPRNTQSNRKRGLHLAEYPEDLHLRLCVTCGGKALLAKLKAL